MNRESLSVCLYMLERKSVRPDFGTETAHGILSVRLQRPAFGMPVSQMNRYDEEFPLCERSAHPQAAYNF